MQNFVNVFVGDKIFWINKDTIKKCKTLEDQLFLGYSPTENRTFLDEDPVIFNHILNLLRDKKYPFPSMYIYRLAYYFIERPDNVAEYSTINIRYDVYRSSDFDPGEF
jgi:hypothetical protein